MMMQMLRTHPFVITNGIMRENPFYVPPDEMLTEIRRRNSGHN
jgi:hypothetical protein